MENYFTEQQALTHQTSVKWIFRINFFVYVVGIIIGFMLDRSLFQAFIVLFIFTLLLYLLLNKLVMKTSLTSTDLKLNHPFVGSFQIPIAEISSIELIRFSFPNNRRSFHKQLGTLYRIYGNEGILVKMKNRNTFFVGSQQVDVLAKEIQHKLKMKDTNQAD